MSGKQRNYRKKKVVDEEEEVDAAVVRGLDRIELLKETRELQKARARAKGIGADSLCGAAGSAYATTAARDELGEVLQDTFATHVEDESTAEELRMQKYVEENMKMKTGAAEEEEELDEGLVAKMEAEKDLYAVPDNLKGMEGAKQDAEGANGFMTGIVEVQLPAKFKIQNIEATEAAKRALLEKRGRKGHASSAHLEDGPSPGFGDEAFKSAKREMPRAFGEGGGRKVAGKDVASDDLAMSRFKSREAKRRR